MMQYSIEGLPHEVWNELAGIDAARPADSAQNSKQYAMAEARPEMMEPLWSVGIDE